MMYLFGRSVLCLCSISVTYFLYNLLYWLKILEFCKLPETHFTLLFIPGIVVFPHLLEFLIYFDFVYFLFLCVLSPFIIFLWGLSVAS